MTPPVYGAPIAEAAREAFANLRARGQRSGLALLGIVIGVASIIALLNIGHIAQLETAKYFARLGVDMIQVRAVSRGGQPAGFDRSVVERLPLTDPDIVDATPFAMTRVVAFADDLDAPVMVTAAPPELASVVGLRARRGRLIRDIDDCSLVAVAGARAASRLAPRADLLPGRQVAVGDYLFTVIGVLEPMTREALSSVNYDDVFLIPFPCARRVLPSENATAALVRVRKDADVDLVSDRLKDALANDATGIRTLNAKSIIIAMNRQKAVHTRMLAAIGGISLLVGGIGVMNVMLMNVLERRREIGLRAAVGATPRDIQIMFLLEAGILGAAGGVAGALFGVLATAVAAHVSGWTFSIAFHVLPIGPLGAGVIGLMFGVYPAIAASRIDPIEALRAD